MKCQDVDRYLQPYVDGEFDGNELSEIEQHFKFCPVCQKKVAFETWFKRGVRQSITDTAPPRRLRSNIAVELRRQKRQDTPLWLKAAPAMAIVLITLGVFFMPRIEVHPPIVQATVDKHLKNLPFDVQSTDSNRVRDYFQEKINYQVRIPRFQQHHLTLLGGRVASVQDHSAAYIAFHGGNGKRYSMMVKRSLEELPEDLGAQRRIIGNRQVAVVNYNGFNVVVWQVNQIQYSLTSDEDENALLKLVEEAVDDEETPTVPIQPNEFPIAAEEAAAGSY